MRKQTQTNERDILERIFVSVAIGDDHFSKSHSIFRQENIVSSHNRTVDKCSSLPPPLSFTSSSSSSSLFISSSYPLLVLKSLWFLTWPSFYSFSPTHVKINTLPRLKYIIFSRLKIIMFIFIIYIYIKMLGKKNNLHMKNKRYTMSIWRM